MAKIALVSCTKSKMDYPCKAKELYMASARFAKAYEYAEMIADKVYILSAKYGLVAEDTILEPYDETLKDKDVEERRTWSRYILDNLKDECSIEEDQFIVIAGKDYNEFLIPEIKNCWLPLKGKRQGEWIPELNRLIEIHRESNICPSLHMIFNNLTRYDWTTIRDIPYENGIYIMFESGESYMGGPNCASWYSSGTR